MYLRFLSAKSQGKAGREKAVLMTLPPTPAQPSACLRGAPGQTLQSQGKGPRERDSFSLTL